MDAEIESLDQLRRRVTEVGDLVGAWIQSLDLSQEASALAAVDVTGAVFLGCDFAPGGEADLEARGALVFPALPDLPFNPYRSGLYQPAELYVDLADGYRHTLDARVYRWWHYVGRRRSLSSELAMALHDHAIVEALDDLQLTGAIGVMGGHQLTRGTTGYADAAALGQSLAAAGRTVITGGGPGAMEAVNLGAALAPTADLAAAVAVLATHPDFSDGVDGWARAAFSVADRWELTGQSYGIPTWLYGHEPPNIFNNGIAKLFSNAIREDVLLRQASGGLVCLPGAAGTVQEIFQAVTPRYYASEEDTIAPLILVDVDYWRSAMPAWPLLEALAAGRPLAGAVHLVDTVAEVPALVLG